MKFYIMLLTIVITMILVAPALAGEEPYKAAVYEDSEIPPFYISQKLAQFTHPETFYYGQCGYWIHPEDGIPIDPNVCFLPDPDRSEYFWCLSKCQERFSSKTTLRFPEVCCDEQTVNTFRCSKTGELCVEDKDCAQPAGLIVSETDRNKCESECPDIENSRITSGHSGWYEWVIGLPIIPEGEINIEIECGVLKPNAWAFFGHDAINLCASEMGEILDPGICKRKPGSELKASALPTITAIAYPGAQNDFIPFHLTAYKSPSKLVAYTYSKDTEEHQVLDGSKRSRIALKACMEESIMVLWPKEGRLNAYDKDQNPENGLQPETEASLEAGDLIKVRMDVPLANTVDIYCSQYSVKIGGIGEPPWVPAGELRCLYDEDDCGGL